jgi:hypothetical protein
MQPDDRPEFLRILNGLAAVKPGAKLTPEALDLWWSAHADWPIDEFKSAAGQLAKTVEFFPNPYHFAQLRKAGGQTAGEAWALVRETVRRTGWGEPTSISPRIDRVVRAMGGYDALGMTNTDAMPFREKRFVELWEEFGEADEARAALPSTQRLSGPTGASKLLERPRP